MLKENMMKAVLIFVTISMITLQGMQETSSQEKRKINKQVRLWQILSSDRCLDLKFLSALYLIKHFANFTIINNEKIPLELRQYVVNIKMNLGNKLVDLLTNHNSKATKKSKNLSIEEIEEILKIDRLNSQERLENIECLLDAGANPNITIKTKSDKIPQTLLEFVYFNQEEDIIILLINAGADLDEQYQNDWTILNLAACSREVEIVKALINAGANLNLQNNFGNTPLMSAAYYPDAFETIKLLIDARADVTLKNKENKTVFDIALSTRNYEIIKLLQN